MSTASRSPTRAPTIVNDSSSKNAALKGAALAFGRPAPKPGVQRNNSYIAANGALAAAATAGGGSKSPSPKRQPAPFLARSNTSGSIQSVKSNAPKELPTWREGATPNLQLPPNPQRGHAKSPSQTAASLAAARAPSPAMASKNNTMNARSQTNATKRPAAPPKPRRLSSHQSGASRGNSESSNDLTSIAPTTSLVDLYERKASGRDSSAKRPEPIVIKPSKDLALKSPKPIRTSTGGITSMFQIELESPQDEPRPAVQESAREVPDAASRQQRRASDDSYVSASESVASPSPPGAIRRRSSENTMPLPPTPGAAAQRTSHSALPFRGRPSQAIEIQKAPPRSMTNPPETFSPSSASAKSLQAQYNRMHPRKMTPSMTGDQLANAMVASSLASSRAPSPQKLQPPPPPTRRQKQGTLPVVFSRTPSPAKKGMKKTLRQTESDSDEDEVDDKMHPYGKHKKKRLMRKHPNKHHEGDRKRWREAVTERERKRYEGVWAANKGLLPTTSTSLQQSSPSSQHTVIRHGTATDHVSNIVVRDIWQRSRLPNTVLEVVWDLVDEESVGRLSKQEFVVGMWLIDQRLKGRKLPVKVSETVWASVRALQGIKIRK